MADPVCIICEEAGGELRNIQRAAINTLIESSRKRRSQKHLIWSTLTSAFAHKTCIASFNRESSIKAAAAEFARICGETCHKKHKIKSVRKNDTKEKILTIIKDRKLSDVFHKNIVARLNNIKDLVEVEARYHSQCMSKLYVPSECTVDFIEHAIKYIDNNESQSQFSLNEIKEDFGGTTFPDLRTIKSKLSDYYKDRVQFINISKDLIILFTHKVSKKTWTEWYQNQSTDPKEERKRIIEMAG